VSLLQNRPVDVKVLDLAPDADGPEVDGKLLRYCHRAMAAATSCHVDVDAMPLASGPPVQELLVVEQGAHPFRVAPD
jgi:hypothetical protein